MRLETGIVSQGVEASGRGPDGTLFPSLLSLGRGGEVPRGILTWTWLWKVAWAFCGRVEARPPGIEELIFLSLEDPCGCIFMGSRSKELQLLLMVTSSTVACLSLYPQILGQYWYAGLARSVNLMNI